MTRRRFWIGALSAGLTLAGRADADGPFVGAVRIARRGSEFAAYRARPPGGPSGSPVLVFAPVIAGPCAPMHRAFADRLAREGFYVIMPDLPDLPEQADIAAVYDFAAREGASARRIGMVGYDGGTRTVDEALARNARIVAAVAYRGPLLANPISRPENAGRTPGGARILVLTGRPGFIYDPDPAWGGGLDWLRSQLV